MGRAWVVVGLGVVLLAAGCAGIAPVVAPDEGGTVTDAGETASDLGGGGDSKAPDVATPKVCEARETTPICDGAMGTAPTQFTDLSDAPACAPGDLPEDAVEVELKVKVDAIYVTSAERLRLYRVSSDAKACAPKCFELSGSPDVSWKIAPARDRGGVLTERYFFSAEERPQVECVIEK